MSTRHPTVLSTFTGAGGLDLGLECAGFSNVGCIELDPVARNTLSANRPSWALLEPGDICDVAGYLVPSDLGLAPGKLDLMAGGPPCQPFSKASQWSKNGRQGLDDPRGEGLMAFLTLVASFAPKAILIENVPGFVRGSTSAVETLNAAFREINAAIGSRYDAQYRVINAVDYGVPQRRDRAIVAAFHDGRRFNWPTATHTAKPVRAWDALAGLSSEDPPQGRGKWIDLLPSIPEGENYQWHTRKGGGRTLFGYRTRYWSFLLKLAKNRPAWTLAAQPGPSTGPFHWDNRPLAVSEMLRLQSFPANWKVEGTHREQVLQVGNATPPLLAEVLGRTILAQLSGRSTSTTSLQIPRRNRIPTAARVLPVPRTFRYLEGDHADHPGTGLGPSPIGVPDNEQVA